MANQTWSVVRRLWRAFNFRIPQDPINESDAFENDSFLHDPFIMEEYQQPPIKPEDVPDEKVRNPYMLADRMLDKARDDEVLALELLLQLRPSLPLDCALIALKVAIKNRPSQDHPHQ